MKVTTKPLKLLFVVTVGVSPVGVDGRSPWGGGAGFDGGGFEVAGFDAGGFDVGGFDTGGFDVGGLADLDVVVCGLETIVVTRPLAVVVTVPSGGMETLSLLDGWFWPLPLRPVGLGGGGAELFGPEVGLIEADVVPGGNAEPLPESVDESVAIPAPPLAARPEACGEFLPPPCMSSVPRTPAPATTMRTTARTTATRRRRFGPMGPAGGSGLAVVAGRGAPAAVAVSAPIGSAGF